MVAFSILISQVLFPSITYPGSLNNSLIEFLKNVNYNQKIHLLLKLILIISLVFTIIKKQYNFRNQILFLVISSLTIIFFRLPNTLLPEQNLDESVYIAGVSSILNDPKVWYSFDCLTAGPLNSYLLSLSYWLFDSANYTTIRIIGILFCTIPTIISLFYAILFLYGPRTAYCVTFGFTLFNASLTFFDFIGYSSELIPHLLLSLELLCFSAILSGRSFSYAYFLCFIAGLIPYAKLQGVLVAFLVVVFLFIEIRNRLTVQKVTGLLFCGLIPSILLLIYLFSNSLYLDFINSYILFNLEYSGSLTDLKWSLVPRLVFHSPDIAPFVISISVLLSIAMVRILTLKSNLHKYRIVYCLILIAVIWFSIIKPGQSFNHYLIFLFFPLFWCLGIVLGELQKIKSINSSIYVNLLYGLFLILTISTFPTKNTGIEFVFHSKQTSTPLISTIQSVAKPDDQMSIWGHGDLAHLYCYTSLTPGTRDVFATRQINPSALQPYFINRYIADLYRNKPRFILEDDHYLNYQTHLQTAFPALNQYYQLYSLQGTVKIYIRKNGFLSASFPKPE